VSDPVHRGGLRRIDRGGFRFTDRGEDVRARQISIIYQSNSNDHFRI